jgi:hypothetical protein
MKRLFLLILFGAFFLIWNIPTESKAVCEPGGLTIQSCSNVQAIYDLPAVEIGSPVLSIPLKFLTSDVLVSWVNVPANIESYNLPGNHNGNSINSVTPGEVYIGDNSTLLVSTINNTKQNCKHTGFTGGVGLKIPTNHFY